MPPLLHNLPPFLAETSGGFIRWLLGLRRIDPGESAVELGWRYPLPLWAWVLIAAAVAALAALSYRRLLGRRSGRVALTAARAGLLLMIAMLLAGPMLVLPREHVEPGRVLMLVDRSESMTVRDVLDPADPDALRTRHEHLGRLLDRHAPVWARLAEEHRVGWLGFADHLEPLAPAAEPNDAPSPADADPNGPEPAAPPLPLTAPDGQATAIRSALEHAVRDAAGSPISGIVLFTDGRSTEPMSPDTLRLLQQAGASVWAVPIGSPEAPLDLAIARADAPDRAFVNDTVPVSVIVHRTDRADDNDDAAPRGTVLRLIDERTGDTLDEQTVERLGQPIHLLTTPEAAGEATWRAEVATAEPELTEANNRLSLDVTLVDRPIRVLYVEGYPRWEYRYLKNMAVREDSIESSIMLIEADRTFAQEGDVPLRRLPRTEEEIDPYDVIVIGDVPAGFFSSDQLRLFEEQVAERGAGLLWIGGPRSTPASYAGSAIASMLPMGGASSLSMLNPPIVMVPTSTAEALGVLRLRTPGASDDADALWPENLPPLRWAQAIESMKPAAEPLAIDERSTQPLVVRMRFGAGQTIYLATDEVWRWRYGRGELYVEQFWMQLIRLLARQRLQTGLDADRAMLAASHRRAGTGDTITVDLTITDQTLLEGRMDMIEVEITPTSEQDEGFGRRRGERSETITLTPTARDGRFRGTWTPRHPGRMALRVTTDALADLGLEDIVQVDRADAEMHYPATDFDTLAELAERTGGAVLRDGDLADLDELIPNRARRTPADITEPLYHSPLAFALLALLLTGEWIGRRLLGLA